MQHTISSEIARILVEERIAATGRVRPLRAPRDRRPARRHRLPGLGAALRLS